MDECLVSDVLKWSSVTSPLPQKLLSLIGITAYLEESCSVRFVVVREALPACVHVTVIQPVVGIAIQNTQRNVQHSGDVSFVCVRFLWYELMYDTLLAIPNGRTRRGPGCCLSTCSAFTERVIPYPHLFPWRYKCFVNFHELAMYFQRYGFLHMQIYEVIWRIVLWNALFQLWNSMTDHLQIWYQGYFIGDFLIFKFSEWVIAYCSTAGKCMKYEERNPAANWLSLLTFRQFLCSNRPDFFLEVLKSPFLNSWHSYK
jgi:hypothetical protein